MFRVFNNPEFMSQRDVVKAYPGSKFIMRDINDDEDPQGYLIAVSSDRDSFKDLCDLAKELSEKEQEVIVMGSYGGARVGIVKK